MKKIRIGSGAGYSGDRLEPALELIKNGNLDYICFECLAERTIAIAQQQKNANPNKGYNDLLEYRMEKVLPLAYKNKVKIITNMGAANVEKAVEAVVKILNKLNIKGIRIAGVIGDDIFKNINKYEDYTILETGKKLNELTDIISANVYVGYGGIVEALQGGADVIITGRTADPGLFLAPIVYEFGWKKDDYDLLGKGTLIGHLLECSGQVSGGYFAVPGIKDVEDLWNLGSPIAEVFENGDAVISKIRGTGGRIDIQTCTEQLLYEIHDPSSYITPDCVADFSKVLFVEISPNEVMVKNGTGREKTDTLKVSVGYKNGFMCTSGMSYGGSKCYERAVLAGEIVKKRLEYYNMEPEELRIDIMGFNSLFTKPIWKRNPDISEVRLRVAARTTDRESAVYIANEVETLSVCGPAGGGGLEKSVKEIIAIASILIPWEDVTVEVIYEEV